jgi:hypothetical protein
MAGWLRIARFTSVAVAVTALIVTSCNNGPTLYPVTGKVLFQDKPVEGAHVVFHPADPAAPMPSGKTGPGGTFTLSTHPHGPGAPAGEYIVVVTQYPADAHEQENPKNMLPDRYADVSLGLLKATVRAGPNELEPFRLTRK